MILIEFLDYERVKSLLNANMHAGDMAAPSDFAQLYHNKNCFLSIRMVSDPRAQLVTGRE
jgi:hypothetical protein